MLSWEAAEAYLQTAEPGSATDEFIDSLCTHVFDLPNTPDATHTLVIALDHAQNTLTRRSVALALALSAPPSDTVAVDALVKTYRQSQDTDFLAPSILEALGILGLRNSLARLETASALLRIDLHSSRYLLIKAAKIIGRLDAVQSDPILQNKLQQLSTASDLAVQSEASYQLGLIALTNALLAMDRTQLNHRLADAQAAFVRAEMTEEIRDDATLFRLLIDAVVTMHGLATEPAKTAQGLSTYLDDIHTQLEQLNKRIWKDYRSTEANLLALRVLNVVDALKRALHTSNAADDWTNFDAVLIDLATVHMLIRTHILEKDVPSRLEAAMTSIAESVLSPQLGPVLLRTIGRRRIRRVIEQYLSDPAHDSAIADSLQALEQAAMMSEVGSDQASVQHHFRQFPELATRLNAPATEVLRDFLEAVDSYNVGRWIEQVGLGRVLLPIDRPDFYGSDPSVNDTVRHVLQQVQTQLQPYPIQKWQRLVQTLVALVSFVHHVRDIMPDYTTCIEDGGLGQNASERHLQDHLFEILRMHVQRNATYEMPRIGGGRPDNGVRFEEAFFPIEVKAEFRSVDPRHIREDYLTQVDIYAAASDRVAFLMVLDVRNHNATGHMSRAKQRSRQKQSFEHTSLYSLEDSFWVDALPLDPQIPHMRHKVIIVGLVPGNRPRPSSTTSYSARPSRSKKK